MVAAGRSVNVWVRYVPIILAIAGFTLGNQSGPDAPRPTVPPQAPNRTALDNICLARSARDVEASIFEHPVCLETHWDLRDSQVATPSGTGTGNSSSTIDPVPPASGTVDAKDTAEQDQDADSLLDSASFLSFEDWKKQNLAKAGQSAENVGGGRRAVVGDKDGRRQPGINNALDSLGDDTEIELDFGGFGAETPEVSPTAWGTPIPSQYATKVDADAGSDVHLQGVLPADASRRKDAGTTCKERFNYASFDCASTVLKTNPECKGSSSVLVENKDSYMLNECRAQNKFLILELCDDILVDTVVLANYEFFSSIFHTFRVSVSDRYPAKPDQWKELGVYEARNTREVQAFAVENSLIWARYLRIEFLTHYGHEFYCPVSLIRVHGTTMMEEYKHDESVGRGEHEVVQAIETSESHDTQTEPVVSPVDDSVKEGTAISPAEICLNPLSQIETVLLGLSPAVVETCNVDERPTTGALFERTDNATQPHQPAASNSTVSSEGNGHATDPRQFTTQEAAKAARKPDNAKDVSTTPDASAVASEPMKPPKSADQNSTVESAGKATFNPKDEQPSAPPESTRPTSTQPPASNPTTQESFFKSVHKRLQMLESNSSLSLLYIEEQSRILRDAFNKVEKRQLSKTSNFLENLNITVVNELKEFREQYDYVWRSVAFEFDHQRMQYHQEVHAMSAQLGVLADELVFQKRVTVIQSIMVMCCFALVLFSRGSVSNYMEFPRVQRMVARSYMRSPASTSPSASPGSTRPSSYREKVDHRRNLSDSSSSQESMASPTVNYVPPTPTSDASQPLDDKVRSPETPESMSVPTGQFRSQSVPPELEGHVSELDMADDVVEVPAAPPRASPA
ncbi:hypothetical protein N7492_000343 [Penicillium capsulatum]|uniref:SUN domain-containing protein n=1 Tax=Penicillium capsulatum TaxID=69766 RepID=A0A9W9IRP1_9EURO|nr:hypothetical protein N7492_000343 [Penicillium capsulatum]KAJ6130593.1 hypothetical protein N7512_003373 [Penicillium capsulatum]